VPHHIELRKVVQTTGGLLVGATILVGTSSADEFEGGLQMDVRFHPTRRHEA